MKNSLFRSLLKEQARLTSNSKMMPVMLYLRGISAKGLNHVLDFIYKGSINLAQEELNDFLAVGESLQIPLMERPTPSPAKRAPPAPKSVEKNKRARVVLPRVLPMEQEAPPEDEPSIPTEELSLSESAATPSEDMYEGDNVADAAPEENFYDGGENDDVEEDDFQDDGGADPAPEQQQPVAVAGPSDGTPTETGLIVDGEHTLSVDELMRDYVKICKGGSDSICLVCGKKLGSVSMKRHMREIHLTSGRDYHCPTCDEF